MEDTPKRRPGRPKKEDVPPLKGNAVQRGAEDKGRFFADQYENSQKKLKAANEEIKSLKDEIYQLKKKNREAAAIQSTASADQQTVAQLKIEGTKEYKDLQASADDLRRRVENFQKKYKDEKEENARLNAAIEKLQSDNDALAHQGDELAITKETLAKREYALALRRETEEKLAALLKENEDKLKQAALDKAYLEQTVELASERIRELESIEDSHYIEPVVTFTAKPVFDQTDLITGLCRFIAHNAEQGDGQHEKNALEKIGVQTLPQT